MSSNDVSSFAIDFVKELGSKLDECLSQNTAANRSQDDVRQDHSFGAAVASKTELTYLRKLPSRTELLEILDTFEAQSTLAAPAATSQAGDLETQRREEAVSFLRLSYLTAALSLNHVIDEASLLGDQEWYWIGIEDEILKTGNYLLQTLPGRLATLVRAASIVIVENASRSMSTSSQTRSSRSLFDLQFLREMYAFIRSSPDFAIATLFPATQQPSQFEDDAASTMSTSQMPKLKVAFRSAGKLSPVRLTRHEARQKRKDLIRRREELAETIGQLATILQNQHQALSQQTSLGMETLLSNATQVTQQVEAALGRASSEDRNPLRQLRSVLTTSLAQHEPGKIFQTTLSASPVGLGPPSTIARLWPTFVFVPAVSLLALRTFSKNKDALKEAIANGKATIRGFFIGWVYEPAMKLLETVRQGEEASGLLVSKASLQTDLDSLKRMVTDFSREKYSLSEQELSQIAAKVAEGDLTGVLKVYETELKSPLKSAVNGSLIRVLLIQVQKAKVDLEVAMSGIDSLLKSQQLLFGAVGIAPAMGITYFAFSWLRGRFAKATNRRAGKNGYEVKLRVWEALRRIDRMLANPSSTKADNKKQTGNGEIDAKTRGLLLLDLSMIRSSASALVAGAPAAKHQTARQRLRRQLLEDIRDLELLRIPSSSSSSSIADQDGSSVAQVGLMAWQARRVVVERIWRSWAPLISVGG